MLNVNPAFSGRSAFNQIYLEQIKGIYGSKLDFDLIEDLIKKYAETRTKIFRLEKAWQKFTPPMK